MHALRLSFLCLLVGSPAQAAWHQVSSPHFLIYSDDRPDRLREFAVRLERFDQAVRVIRNMQDLPPSSGNRVTIFVLKDVAAVRALANDKSGFVQGFYRPGAEGAVAFVPGQLEESDENYNVTLVFLHEYAHHLMMQELATPYPEWLIEGFAEFMSTTRFEKGGAVGLGLPAKHRAFGLSLGPSLPLETMLSGKYETKTIGERESIYGRGWLMTHFFVFEQSRKGQLNKYLAGIANGSDPLDAARSAFGDLKMLDRDLEKYMRRQRLNYLRLPPEMLKTPTISVSPLGPGAASVMPMLIELKNGAGREAVEKFAPRLRALASQYPSELLVQTTAAEAELVLENVDAAEAAADRALSADPKSTDAMLLKGQAIMDRGKKADRLDPKAFSAARQWFIRANKLDPEDPEPLMRFYMSFPFAGERPTANAIAALHYASNLAPQDLGLRLNSALQYLRDGNVKEARLTLAPIAYNPHGRETASMARKMIEKIDAGDLKAAEDVGTE